MLSVEFQSHRIPVGRFLNKCSTGLLMHVALGNYLSFGFGFTTV